MSKSSRAIIASLFLVISYQLCQASPNSATPRLRIETQHAVALLNATQKEATVSRDLQDFNYRANYVAQFQVIQDAECIGPDPVIRVNCIRPSMKLLGTSDPSIVCSEVPMLDEYGWSYIECNNTCSNAACEEIYLVVGGASNDGPFGEISFQCAGDVADDIDAFVSFEDSGNGFCDTASSSSPRNYHIARMGVSCPTNIFDDFYFECINNKFPADGNPGDVYTCFEGEACNQGDACDVDFDRIIVSADVPNFLDKCVEALVPLSPAPTPEIISTATYTARFSAAWGLLFDAVSDPFCFGSTPTVRMTCRNGNIKFVRSRYGTANCTNVRRGVMECTDTTTANFVNQFTGVVYVSTTRVLSWLLFLFSSS
jgi:hypothetical protein